MAAPPAQPGRTSLLPRVRGSDVWSYLGPAFVASIAYIDPGNFAANFAGGSQFGYKLLWVLLWSNLMAILVQYLVRQAGHRYRQNASGKLPRPLLPPDYPSAVDHCRTRRHGHRSGRVSGRGARLLPALWPAVPPLRLEQNRDPAGLRRHHRHLRLPYSCCSSCGAIASWSWASCSSSASSASATRSRC